jgi:hypothetical protein
MRKLALAALLPLIPVAALAAVSGTVLNRSTGKPMAGATVGFFQFGQGGMEEVAKATADAGGKFSIDRAPAAQVPSMLRVEVGNVTYNKMLPPGTPTTGVEIDVYDVARQPGPGVKVGKHMILFQPSGGRMTVNETYLYQNTGNVTWADPAAGTLRFYLPPAAKGAVEVQAAAPDGLPVPVPSEKTSRPNIYTAKFEIKPGETRFDLSYTVPYTEGEPYSGTIATKDDNTYLIAAAGVTLQGANLNDLGLEPRTQAHIYGLTGASYRVELTGSAAPPAEASAPQDDQENAGPSIEQIMPRINSRTVPIVAATLGILALGFALLYRASATGAKETDGRRRG